MNNKIKKLYVKIKNKYFKTNFMSFFFHINKYQPSPISNTSILNDPKFDNNKSSASLVAKKYDANAIQELQ